MHLYCDNVNDAFTCIVRGFETGRFPLQPHCPTEHGGSTSDWYYPVICQQHTRNGPALVICEPVTVSYTNPRKRVLFNHGRDANPFFHLVEALWMLAGRNDVAPLGYYCKNILQFSDDGNTLNGAYGYRWRKWFGMDQVEYAIQALLNSPNTRRCVVQMWQPADLLNTASRDVPCNTQIMFQLRNSTLDMTVINRSNDLIWGMLGSNYVHFTFLQEYVALACGAAVGQYHHFTNNLHAYIPGSGAGTNAFDPSRLLEDPVDWYASPPGSSYSPPGLYTDRHAFDEDLKQLFSAPPHQHHLARFTTSFCNNVVSPILKAWHCYKHRNSAAGACTLYHPAESALAAAIQHCKGIGAEDWRIACTRWMQSRLNRLLVAMDNGVQAACPA